MTPCKEFISEGVLYLGLGIKEECYLAPYFWRLPTIMPLDYEHNQRSATRMLKYATLDMIMFEDELQTFHVSIEHIHQLRQECLSRSIQLALTEKDLILLKYFDQNSDVGYKLFTPRIADLLDKYVPGSLGTSLYIRAVTAIMEPFIGQTAVTPVDVVRSVAKGVTMLRLWRKYLTIKRMRLSAGAGACADPKKRGNFLTKRTYDSLEIQAQAAVCHQLAMFLHLPKANRQASLTGASTISTERFIGQTQAKGSHFHSLNQEPSVKDVIERTFKIENNIKVLQKLKALNVKVAPSSHRKQHINKVNKLSTEGAYEYPDTYEDFRTDLIKAYDEGMQEGRTEMEKLPDSFRRLLQNSHAWLTPYEFPQYKHVKTVSSPPEYDKIDIRLPLRKEQDVGKNDISDEEDVTELTDSSNTHTSFGEQESNSSEEMLTDKQVQRNEWSVMRGNRVVDVRTALKIIIGSKDYVSKDRNKRHRAMRFLPNLAPIPSEHDIVLYNYVAVCIKRQIKIVYITCIESDAGNRERSTSSSLQSRFRGVVCHVEQGTMELVRPSVSLITTWCAARGALALIQTCKVQNSLYLVKDSFELLQELQLDKKKNVGSLQANQTETCKIEKVLARRINRHTHECKYLTKFIGCKEDQNAWLPESCFQDTAMLTTKSSRGRIRRHRGLANSEVVIVRGRKRIIDELSSSDGEEDARDKGTQQSTKRGRKRIIAEVSPSDSEEVEASGKRTRQYKREECNSKKPQVSTVTIGDSTSSEGEQDVKIYDEAVTKPKKRAASNLIQSATSSQSRKSNRSTENMESQNHRMNTSNLTLFKGLTAVGIKNIGQSCWFNSAFQAMRFVLPKFDGNDILLEALQGLKEEIERSKRSFIYPGTALDIACLELGFDKALQQDTSDLVRAVLWHESANSGVNVTIDTDCLSCGHIGTVDGSSTYLQISMCTETEGDMPLYHQSVEECFNAFLNIEERLASITCAFAGCGTVGPAIRRFNLHSCGKLLVIMLTRFNDRGKLQHRVELSRCLRVVADIYHLRAVQITLVC